MFSQDNNAAGRRSVVPVINFQNGVLDRDLPYREAFYLKGKATTFKGNPADVVVLQIYEAPRGCKKNCTIDCSFSGKALYNKIWKKSEESDEFDFLVNANLKFGKCYKLEFRFYTQQEIKAARIKSYFESIYRSYTISGREFSNTTEVIVELLKSQVAGDLKSEAQKKVVANDFMKELRQNTGVIPAAVKELSGTELFLQGEVPSWITEVKDTNALAFQIGNYINYSISIAETELQIRQAREELASFYDEQFYKDLTQLAVQKSALVKEKNIDFTIPRIKQLESFQKNGPLVNAQELFDALDPLIKADDLIIDNQITRRTLAALLSNLENIIVQIEEIKGFESSLAQTNAEIDKIIKPIDDQYILVDINSAAAATGFSSTSELEATKFSVPIGFGVTMLNPNENTSEYRGLGYLGLRYYFGPVDKRLIKDPYLGNTWPFKRMSIVAGVLVGTEYNYRGQELKNIFGVKPILGLGYDISRFFTIDFGIITFNQARVNPLDPRDNIRIAPQISVSLEADLFNRIQSLSKNQKYSKFSSAFGLTP